MVQKRNLAKNVNCASIEPVECITGEVDDQVLDQVWIDYHTLSRSFILVCKRNFEDTLETCVRKTFLFFQYKTNSGKKYPQYFYTLSARGRFNCKVICSQVVCSEVSHV